MSILCEDLKKETFNYFREEQKRKLKLELKRIDDEVDYYMNKKLSKPVPFFTNRVPKISRMEGLYFVIHSKDTFWFKDNFYVTGKFKPDAQVMYIGQGCIGQRRSKHKSVFNNNGKPKTYSTGGTGTTSSFDSPAGRKMWQYDDNRQNWFFAWIECPKIWSPRLEELYCYELNPLFNDDKMNGVG